MINTITINSATCSAVLSPLWQYDYGQYLKIEGIDLPQSFEVDFATIDQSSSVTMLGEDGQVKVPDDMLDEGVDITAYIYLHSDETDGYTEYVIQIPVISRPERTEETPTPQEQTLIEQAIVVLNHAVEQTGQDVEAAQQAAEDAETAAQTATEASQTATDAATSASASATSAAQSASDAQSAVASIGDSVIRAESAATTAQSAAQTATTKAAEATTSAGTAATNATTALNAASQAAQSATQAAASVTSAQTAQTAAEAAQIAAQTAQTAAESAAASAEAQADRAEGYADRMIDVYPTDTASGSIASFTDGAGGIPVKSLVVNVEPNQDLNGYDNPWPAGGGKNKLDWETVWAAFLSDGVLVNPIATVIYNIPSDLVGKQLTFSAKIKANSTRANCRVVCNVGGTNTNGTLINNTSDFETSSVTFTPQSTNDYILLGSSGANGTYKELQLEVSSTATSYAPYSNVCPITGWTGANVTVSPTLDPQDGTTIPITWQTEAGTVYGGTVDVTNGKLTSCPYYASYNGEALVGPWVSSMDAYTPGGTPTTGAQVVDLGGTVTEYTLTTEQVVNTLKGQNTFWADCGDSSVTYRADIGLFIDKKLAALAAALG